MTANRAQPGVVIFDTPCVECGLVVVFQESPRALTFGHIYSREGLKEYAISGLCEWCFDILTDFEHMGRGVDTPGNPR